MIIGHFRSFLSLVSTLEKDDYSVVSYDEAFNKVSEKRQMDLVSKYIDEVNNQVTVRYLNSALLGNKFSEDILESFKSSLNPIEVSGTLKQWI